MVRKVFKSYLSIRGVWLAASTRLAGFSLATIANFLTWTTTATIEGNSLMVSHSLPFVARCPSSTPPPQSLPLADLIQGAVG